MSVNAGEEGSIYISLQYREHEAPCKPPEQRPTCALQIIKRPGPGLLAFLLGVAIGVMFTLSAAEMYIRNAYEHGFWSITASVLGGVALYYFLQPFLPDFVDHNHDKKNSEVSPMD